MDLGEKMNETISGEIPVKFTYQPIIGGKHEVFLTGDFNNWSKSEILMKINVLIKYLENLKI